MTLIINHIPKTSGTSLRFLISKFNPDSIWAYDGEMSLANPDLEFALNFKKKPPPALVMGHFSYGVHRILGLQPCYATILRDPVDRVVSLYRHQKRHTGSNASKSFKVGMSLIEFVESGLSEMTNNHMCRIIAGIPPDAGLFIKDKWLLDLALHNLQRHYSLIGTVKKIDDFVSRLGSMLDWPSYKYPALNVANDPVLNLDDTARSIIIRHNNLDIDLYNLVSSGSLK